jgi:hypothetical protein
VIAVNQNHATAEKWVNIAPMSATVEVGRIHGVRIAHPTPRQPHKYYEREEINGILHNILNGT